MDDDHHEFDILDDEMDLLEYTQPELDAYFQTGLLDEWMRDRYDDEDVGQEEAKKEEPQQVLSQKFSQLSTDEDGHGTKRSLSSNSTPESSMKRTKLIDDDDEDDIQDDTFLFEQEPIPDYLSMDNVMFDELMQRINQSFSPMLDAKQIQQMALLHHHLAAVRIQQEIYLVYLQSGTGHLVKENESDLGTVDRRVWPPQVRSVVYGQRPTTTGLSLEEEYRLAEEWVHRRLQDMENKMLVYVQSMTEKKVQLIEWTSAIDLMVETYVQQQGFRSYRLKSDLKKAVLAHEYRQEILQRQYTCESPNDYQVQIAKRLCDARFGAEQSRRELIEVKLRVFYHRPSTATTTIDGMRVKIQQAELKHQQARRHFEHEYSQMQENHRNLVKDKGMTTALMKIIDRRLTLITDKLRDIAKFRLDFYLRNTFNNSAQVARMGLPSNLIKDTQCPLSDDQERLLERGPAYVSPGQMYSRFTEVSSRSFLDDLLKKHYAPLQHQLASLFFKHHVNIALSMEMNKAISDLFKDLFTISLPESLQRRALFEKRLVQSIRQLLVERGLMLRRTADDQNTFYLGDRLSFEGKAKEYLRQMADTYQVVVSRNDEEDGNDEGLKNELKDMIYSINTFLETMKSRKMLDVQVIKRMEIDPARVRWPYLYFLPTISQDKEVSMVPVIPSKRSVTWQIAKYLQQLLVPFLRETLGSKTFHHEWDFIQKLYHYTYNQQRLTPKTLFCTIKIGNFYTLAAHTQYMDTIVYFLQDNVALNRVQHVPISTIRNLLQLFLLNNIFFYDGKIYSIMKGSPSTIPLSTTLADIYLGEWQKIMVRDLSAMGELFGRSHDQLFFTWKSTRSELESFIRSLGKRFPNVQFDMVAGSQVCFLGAEIENRQGELCTRVYHDPSMRQYTLPYVVGHAKCQHSDWLRWALNRAISYCSSVEDFYQERLYLEMTCLINGYSLLFVETQVDHFFQFLHGSEMRYCLDQQKYHSFRHQWFELMEPHYARSMRMKERDVQGQVLRLHYLYEVGPRHQFNRKFQQLWSKYFDKHPTLSKDKVSMVLGTKHLYSLNSLLSNQKSSSCVFLSL